MAKNIRGFLAGTNYAPCANTDESLLRRGCEAVMDAQIGSAIVVLDDGSFLVAHPTFNLDPAAPELIMRIVRERLMQDDFATRPVRTAVRTRLREIEGMGPREQLTALSELVREHAEFFLSEAGTGMDEATRQREAELDARCGKRRAA